MTAPLVSITELHGLIREFIDDAREEAVDQVTILLLETCGDVDEEAVAALVQAVARHYDRADLYRLDPRHAADLTGATPSGVNGWAEFAQRGEDAARAAGDLLVDEFTRALQVTS